MNPSFSVLDMHSATTVGEVAYHQWVLQRRKRRFGQEIFAAFDEENGRVGQQTWAIFEERGTEVRCQDLNTTPPIKQDDDSCSIMRSPQAKGLLHSVKLILIAWAQLARLEARVRAGEGEVQRLRQLGRFDPGT